MINRRDLRGIRDPLGGRLQGTVSPSSAWRRAYKGDARSRRRWVYANVSAKYRDRESDCATISREESNRVVGDVFVLRELRALWVTISAPSIREQKSNKNRATDLKLTVVRSRHRLSWKSFASRLPIVSFLFFVLIPCNVNKHYSLLRAENRWWALR